MGDRASGNCASRVRTVGVDAAIWLVNEERTLSESDSRYKD